MGVIASRIVQVWFLAVPFVVGFQATVAAQVTVLTAAHEPLVGLRQMSVTVRIADGIKTILLPVVLKAPLSKAAAKRRNGRRGIFVGWAFFGSVASGCRG